MQWLCGWVYAHNALEQSRRWRWQWSLSLYAGLWLLFAAAMGVTGFVHQLGWLMSSKEPILTERKYRGMSRTLMRQASFQIIVAAEDASWDLEATRKEFFAESGNLVSRRRQSIEDLHVLFIPESGGKLAGAILFPRDRAESEQTGFILISKGAERSEKEYPMRELAAVLTRLAKK
jgi:hypothetical protein